MALGEVPIRTLSIMFTCCHNLMFLACPWLKIYRFSNWSFCYFEQFKVDNYWLWTGLSCKACHEINSTSPPRNDENSRTMHKIWHKSFLMIQSVGIKNWFLYSMNNEYTSKAQSYTSSCNSFFWFLWQNKRCMIRIKTQKVLHNWVNIFKMNNFFDSIAKSHI